MNNDLVNLLIGEQDWGFLAWAAVRAAAMFFIALMLLRFTGKKEVRQFSTLELIVIVGLGSAMGDPMIYEKVGLLPASIAILVVLLLYRGATVLTSRNERMSEWLEGEVATGLSNGRLDLELLHQEGWSAGDVFGDLRALHVEHLGQVKTVHIEVDGELSVFFRPDAEVVPGLPIAPALLARPVQARALVSWPASCVCCGYTATRADADPFCPYCGNDQWLPSSSGPRVA